MRHSPLVSGLSKNLLQDGEADHSGILQLRQAAHGPPVAGRLTEKPMENPAQTSQIAPPRPALILGGSLIVACVIIALGAWLAIDRAMSRFERAVAEHAQA